MNLKFEILFCLLITFYVIGNNCQGGDGGDGGETESPNATEFADTPPENYTFNSSMIIDKDHRQIDCEPSNLCKKYGFKTNLIINCTSFSESGRKIFDCDRTNFNPETTNFRTKYELFNENGKHHLKISLTQLKIIRQVFNSLINVTWIDETQHRQIKCKPDDFCELINRDLNKCNENCTFNLTLNCHHELHYKTYITKCDNDLIKKVKPYIKTTYKAMCENENIDEDEDEMHKFDNCWLNMTINRIDRTFDNRDFALLIILLGIFITFGVIFGTLAMYGNHGRGPMKSYFKDY